MPPVINRYTKKIAGELRRSQILTTYGCGALADFPRLSGIMAGLDKWPIFHLTESAKIHERNLEVMLGKEFFYQVSSPDDNLNNSFALPAYRFPTWYYCPECHALDKYNKISRSTYGSKGKYNNSLLCNVCSDKNHPVKLIPSRFIVACINGHLEDFPYVWWAHRKKGICDNPKLRIQYNGTTGGLDSIYISCDSCGATTTMAGCMDKEALKGLRCSRYMPWLGFDDKHWYVDPNNCDATLRCLQRSANNVYYPVNKSALTVPPWSEKLQSVFAANNSLFEDIFDSDEDQVIIGLKKQFHKHPELYGTDLNAFISAANARYKDELEIVDEKSLRCDEYRAFCGEDIDDEYFRTESEDVPDFISLYISKIKLVKKLREVMVLQGFRRILPTHETNVEKRVEEGISENEFSPLSREPMNWLPAIELFGEGIFIELNEEMVSEWEKRNSVRYKKMFDRNDSDWIGKGMFDFKKPRYVLLHTLSHLLIRQLSSQCGYATASIKEKIYSTYTDVDQRMCGILVYTSATDTDGSLGGLVREGQKDRIVTIFENLLQESTWCSNDPLCIESTSQGFKGLNYAACHACTLLPETSCESLNCLLDRAAVVGTPDNLDIAYFKELL